MTTLQRQTFRTSRLLDFCSEKELIAQTGHSPDEWPLVVLKELVDNALDAAEEARCPPEIHVKVEDGRISVSDNGNAIPASTVDGILDYSVRISSREAYVAPDRGAQGNALKTILAMPFVLDGKKGRVDIGATGWEMSEITFEIDRVRGEPMITRETVQVPEKDLGQKGTTVTVYWPSLSKPILAEAKAEFLQIARDYTFLNPHLALSVEWEGERFDIAPTDPLWPKWRPSDPTSPHWYNPDEFKRLISACLTYDEDHPELHSRLVREFVKTFRGLSGSAKQKVVLGATDLAREPLTSLMNGRDLKHDLVDRLLAVMKEETKPVPVSKLGTIGEGHLKKRFASLGCDMETFEYKKATPTEDGVPAVQEVAFAWLGESAEKKDGWIKRQLITGVNWSAGIGNPFRDLGGTYGDGLGSLLSELKASPSEPVVFLMHVACPRVRYTDRGKSAIAIED